MVGAIKRQVAVLELYKQVVTGKIAKLPNGFWDKKDPSSKERFKICFIEAMKNEPNFNREFLINIKNSDMGKYKLATPINRGLFKTLTEAIQYSFPKMKIEAPERRFPSAIKLTPDIFKEMVKWVVLDKLNYKPHTFPLRRHGGNAANILTSNGYSKIYHQAVVNFGSKAVDQFFIEALPEFEILSDPLNDWRVTYTLEDNHKKLALLVSNLVLKSPQLSIEEAVNIGKVLIETKISLDEFSMNNIFKEKMNIKTNDCIHFSDYPNRQVIICNLNYNRGIRYLDSVEIIPLFNTKGYGLLC